MARTPGCRYHCVPCARCFTSLEAFDAHRAGGYDHRYCDNPAAVVVEKSGRRVFASPLAGVCRLSGKPGVVPTQLWELATTREKALRLAAARGGSERQDGSGDGEGRSDLADAAEAA